MKPISAGFLTHIQGLVTTVTTIWKIVRKDATVLGFTSLDVDVTYDGVTYEAGTGADSSALSNRDDLTVGSANLMGLLDSPNITESDIRKKLYDGAKITISMINYEDTTQGTVVLFTGWLGNFTLVNDKFVVEVRGLEEALNENLLRIITPNCDAEFGDQVRCLFDKTTVEQSGSVNVVTSNIEFSTTGITHSSDEEFNEGEIEWLTGDNAGIKSGIKFSDMGTVTITLLLDTDGDIVNGDTFKITPGCDKRRVTCVAYLQILNNRGFPEVPGPSLLFSSPRPKL